MVVRSGRGTLFIYLLLTGLCSNAQHTFNTCLRAAYDSSQHGRFTAALSLLYQAKNLKNIDTGYNESVNMYLGITYEKINKIDSCIYYLGESLPYYEKQKDFSKLDFIYGRLGDVELKFTQRYDKSLAYYKKRLTYCIRQPDSSSIYECLSSIGIVYKYLARYDSALHYFKIIVANNSVHNTAKNIAMRLAADTYSLLHQYDMALRYYDTAIKRLKVVDDKEQLFTAFLNKGDCLMQQNRFGESLYCLEQAERYSESAITENDKKILYENLAFVFSKTGDFKKAFYFKNLEVEIKDRINTHSIEQAAADAEAKYEVRKNKDSLLISTQKLTLSNNKSEQRQRKFIIALMAAAAVGLLLFLALRNAAIRQKANKKLAVQKEKVEKLAGELEVANQTKARLFSVISHDLRSPVSALYALLKIQELKAGSGTTSAAVSNQMMTLLDTLEDLLIWSKSQMDKFKLQPVIIPVQKLYDEMINLYGDTAKAKHIQISNTALKYLKIFTDENLLKAILRNIISNAINYAPEHSTVILGAIEQDHTIVCVIGNEATATDYAALEGKLNNTAVESSKHGLGTVLLKEFMHKLNTALELSYANGRVYLQFSLPAFLK